MSKIIALLFGLFLFMWISGFTIMLIIHISRFIFAKDKILSISEIGQLFIWPLAILNKEGRGKINSIVLQRSKRQ